MCTLITGIHGQDGFYLAERLSALGQTVIGTTHTASRAGTLRLANGTAPVLLLDLSSRAQVEDLIRQYTPNAVYNFAARASSAQLFDDVLATADINGVAVARILEAIRLYSPRTRFCQASSSEVFGDAESTPQSEFTARKPANAYGAAKAFAEHLVSAYRSTHALFACSAILFPHESPRRDVHFLSRKVARAAARIAAGFEQTLTLGDLRVTRDWGYAPDYVEAMRLMLDQPCADDFVIASGESHSVEELCGIAFEHAGLDWHHHVLIDDALKRSPERAPRVGDPRRAHSVLGWRPSISFRQLVVLLVESEQLSESGATTGD